MREAERQKQKNGEEKHVGQGDEIEGFGVATKGVELARMAKKRIRAGHDAEDDHQAAEEKAGDAEFAMDVGASGGDEGCLRDEEDDPDRKGCAMDVNEQIRQGRAENAGEKIAVGEADEDGEEHEDSGDGEEVVVVAAAGKEGRARTDWCGWCGDCGQIASERIGTWSNSRPARNC